MYGLEPSITRVGYPRGTLALAGTAMRTIRFSLIDVIGKMLSAALAKDHGDYPERWVELIEHLNRREAVERKAQEQERNPTLPSSIG
jgi:hypothetical protein